MLCSLLVVTASAEGATATVTLQADKTENLKPGDIISVNVNFTNNTDSVVYLAGVQAKVLYDSNIVELYSGTEYDEALEENVTVDYWKGENEFFKSNGWSYTFGNPTSGEVTVAAGGSVSQKVYATKSSGTAPTRTFATLKFKVLADAESCQTNFSFSTEYNNQVTKYPAKDAARDEVIDDIDYSNVLTTVSIIGVAPTIRSVELQPNSVTVDGTSPKTVQAKAFSTKGTDLTDSVKWAIGTPENGSGVTINENGTITVEPNAKAGQYKVYANKPSSGGSGGGGTTRPRPQSAETRSTVQGSADATLTVTRAPSENKSIAISANKSEIEIPTGNTSETAIFEATFRDQYGDEKTADSVNWSITPSVDGVAINNNGVVTVSKDAKNGIPNSTEFTIKATSGNLTQSSTLTVKRAAAQAASIELGTVNDMTVPVDGANAAEAIVTATVKDQYGAEISNPTVEWSITPADKGVSIDTTGKITVTNAAKEYITDTNGQQFTVTAKSGDVTKTATVTVKRADSIATSMKVFKGDVELTGNKDTIIIPSTNQDNTYTYSAKVYDQYGSEMTSAQPTLTFANATDKVTYNNGTVTVKQSAIKDSTYTLTVSYDGLDSKAIIITAKDIDITWPTVSKKAGTYGDKWSDIVKYSGGSAVLNSAKVDGTFTLKDADTVPNVGAKYQFVFKSTDGTYTVESSAYNAEIAKKPVTITGLTAIDKMYDGNETASVSGTATISGNLDGDNLTVTAGTASFADKNAGTNKTVTFTGYTLSGSAAGNYELPAQPASVTANITQKELTVSAGNLNFTKPYDGTTSVGIKSGNLELTGVISGDMVSVADGYTAAYVDANAGDNKNIELTGLTLKGTDAGNYKLKSTTLTVAGNSITKATWDKTSASSSAKYGTIGTLNLSQYLVSDATVGQVTVTTDTNAVLNGTPSVADKVLTYKFKNDANLKDKTATITIPVTSGNYESYNITVTVTVLDKLTQNDFKFAAAAQTKTYGDSKFTYAATGAVNGSAVTYSSGNTDVATVNKTTGEVTILKAGETTITAAATATDDYAAATQSYTLTVNKAKLTVRPKSYTIRVGDTLPTPEVEYVGLKNNDKAKDIAKLNEGKKLDLEIKNANKTGTLENSSTTGTYEIVFQETPTFQATDNYEIEVVATGTLTINSRSSGSGGSNSSSTSPVSVTTPKNGKVTVSPSNAAKGAAVTVTVTPDSGYEMDKLTVTDASGKTISTTDKGNGKFTFTMPNGKVSVSATFKQTTVTPPSTGFVDVPASAYYADAVKWAVEQGITTGTSTTTFSPEASCTRAQMVTFLWRAAGSPAPKATTTVFTDLDKSAYYYDAVLWAVEKGITTGTSATTFSPNATVTRGQTVTFLYRFAGQPAVSGSSSFTDVNSSDYYAAAVQWAKEQGITSGTSATTFSPTNDCTRGQIVTFLYRQLAK